VEDIKNEALNMNAYKKKKRIVMLRLSSLGMMPVDYCSLSPKFW